MRINESVWSAALLVGCLATIGASTASADLLVHEPFAYADGNLTGQGGALGTTGTWTSNDFLQDSWPIPQDGWRIHQEGDVSGVNLSDANPSNDPTGPNPWDGVVDNLLTSGGYVGLAGPDDTDDPDPFNGEPGRWMDASIALDPSVTATFTSGTTTWFSFVSVRGWDRNEESPQFMIGTDPSPNDARGRFLDNGGDGIGGGGGPTRANFGDVFPAYFSEGINHHTPGGYQDGVLGDHDGVQDEIGPNPDSNGALESGVQTMIWEELDDDGNFAPANIVVGKIQWDADTQGEDVISVVRFLETDTLSEAEFDALIDDLPALSSVNWESNKPDLDQSQFDTLNFSGTKFFVDEIRIGNSFADVTPLSGLSGDYNGDGALNAEDVDLQTAEMKKDPADQDLAKFDHNSDGMVDVDDRLIWVKDLRNTWVGDSNDDNEFGSGDLVKVFTDGLYETGQMANWSSGDWNGDMLFNSSDLVFAFTDGGYEQGPPNAAAAAPEPSSLVLALLSAMGLVAVTRRRND